MIGRRLQLARKARGLSLRDLADRAGEVSAQAIGRYERDEMNPSSRVLLALCRALEIAPEYLLASGGVQLAGVQYRKKHDFRARDAAAVEAQVLSASERYLEIEDLLAMAESFAPPRGFPVAAPSMESSESAARALRDAWNLGLDPIPNLTEFLEERGLKVLSVRLPDKVSGFQAAVSRRSGSPFPIVVVNADEPGERQRFTLAHELAHLLLVPNDEEAREALCHRFASAFLMPAESLFEALGRSRRTLSMGELFLLKPLFGVSAQAIVRRAKDLGVISEGVYGSLFREFSRRGWRRREPNPLVPENPGRFLRLCFHAVSEGLISESRGAELLEVPTREFRAKLDNIGTTGRAADARL